MLPQACNIRILSVVQCMLIYGLMKADELQLHVTDDIPVHCSKINLRDLIICNEVLAL